MVDWTLQNNVAEMSWTTLHALFASKAAAVLVHDTHSGIVYSVKVWLEGLLVVYKRARYFCD